MIYKTLLVLLTSILLVSCHDKDSVENDNVNSVRDIDLTGTWAYVKATEVYKKSTGEYLYTEFTKYTYLFEDTSNGVRYQRCWEYGGDSPYGIKADIYFYTSVNEDGFSLIDRNTLSRSIQSNSEEVPELEFNVVETFKRISDGLTFDSGALNIQGPNVNVSETNNVCYYHVYSSIGISRYFEIIAPYFDDTIILYMSYSSLLTTGNYDSEDNSDFEKINTFDVNSNSTQFWESVGSNTLSADRTTVSITHVENNLIEGSFNFVGQDLQDYSGSFSVQLP